MPNENALLSSTAPPPPSHHPLPIFQDQLVDQLIASLESLPAGPLAGSQRPRQFTQLLSRTALGLRKIGGQKVEEAQGGEGGGHNVGNDAEAIWRRAKLLVELGCADDSRLPSWLAKMGRSMVGGNGQQKAALLALAARLEWICLALNAQSLPPICTPKAAFLPSKVPKCGPVQFQCCAEAAARVDIAGGWTDTPPITYQMGPTVPAVLSMSIRVNGKLPIRCQCSRLEHFHGIFYREKSAGHQQRTIHFPSAAQVFANCSRPSQPGSLICAVLVIAGVVREELRGGQRHHSFHFGGPGRGLLLQTDSDLPHGSGLGSSSILSAALLAALARLRGAEIADDGELLHTVLAVEQLHSTGGGWQDQMGGCLTGGAKLGWVEPDGARQCRWRVVPLGGQLREQLAKRLVLVYTGRTRLAKTLLQEVLLSWARSEPDIRTTVKRLADGAREAEKMLLQGTFPSKCCAEYNELKKHFAANTEPPIVAEFRAELEARRLAEVGWMAGAGGGGFLYLWLADGVDADMVEEMLATADNGHRWKRMSVWRVEMEETRPLDVR